jgi:hypothetical protein
MVADAKQKLLQNRDSLVKLIFDGSNLRQNKFFNGNHKQRLIGMIENTSLLELAFVSASDDRHGIKMRATKNGKVSQSTTVIIS